MRLSGVKVTFSRVARKMIGNSDQHRGDLAESVLYVIKLAGAWPGRGDSGYIEARVLGLVH